MAAKINKEVLLKNRFWIMLGVTVVLGFVGLAYLQTVNADGDKAAALKAIKDAQTRSKGPAVGPAAIEARATQATEAKKKEEEVWLEAFKVQAPLFRWADDVEKEFNFFSGKFALEVTVQKAKDKEIPETTADNIHGILVQVDNDWIRVQTKDKKLEPVKVYRTKAVKIVNADDGNKAIPWANFGQGDLFAAQGSLVNVKVQTGKFFNDALRDVEQRAFAESYLGQIDAILKTVEPLDEKGNGVVQLKNWLYDKDWVKNYPEDKKPDPATHKFIRFVGMDWNYKEKDISDEAWIAQENIWIQKELYRIIRSANDEIKVFQRVGADKAEKRGEINTFKNSYFQLELTLKPDDSLNIVVRNLLPRKQKLDLSFRVTLNKGGTPELIKISGPPLMPAGAKATAEGKSYHDETIEFAKGGKDAPRKGVYRVEQVLTWETAAIKRIDQITIGSMAGDEIAHSHRTFVDALKPLVEEKEAVTEPKEKKDPFGKGGVGGMAGLGMPGPAMGQPGSGATAGGNIGELSHGLWRNRYRDVSKQARQIPVAVALIVDQDHVDRVLTAFNNSKFRFLESQVLLNHYTASLQPAFPDDEKSGPGVGPGVPGSRPPGGVGPGVPPGPGLPKGPMGPPMGPLGSGSGEPQAGGQDLETNMELVIYGMMTIYQRYDTPAAPGAPVAPPTDKK